MKINFHKRIVKVREIKTYISNCINSREKSFFFFQMKMEMKAAGNKVILWDYLNIK